MNSNIALAGTAVVVCLSLALGYLIGKFYGSRRYAEDYIQKPIRAIKRTEGLKVFLDYVAEYSTPEHPAVTELREVDILRFQLKSVREKVQKNKNKP